MSDAKKPILVTAALPYANGSLHLGHMVEYIQADIYVRFLRQTKRKVVFACASDSHGTPIEVAAQKKGISPEELVGAYRKEHMADFEQFNISFDVFHTTHSDENKKYSDFFFNTLKEKGHIYERMVNQLYDEEAKRYLPDRFVKGQCPKCGAPDQYGDHCEKCNAIYKPIELIRPYSILSKTAPVQKTSVHYFFKLTDFEEKLKQWLNNLPAVQPEIKKFIQNWFDEGLEDWDITRDGPYFGFLIPGERTKYFYVWLDAPIGYIAASEKYAQEKLDKTASIYWQEDAGIIHFIGKDIIYFHYLFWPAMLMGVGFNTPKDIPVHGHLTINSEKMSKSRGNFLTAKEYLDQFDPELLRFYYAANLTKSVTDINLDLKDFQSKINNELVANIANFMYRTLSFINNNFDSKIEKIGNHPEDDKIKTSVQQKMDHVIASYEDLNYREAIKAILEIGAIGNKYFQDNAPWKLIKEDVGRCKQVVALSANIVANLTQLLKPVIPSFANKMQKQLDLTSSTIDDLGFSLQNHTINKARIIFTTLDEVPQIGKPVFPAHLKVAVIDEAQDHPNADKLFKLTIHIGEEQRQLVAGLKGFFTKDELKGKKIIVVSNLKHAKIRGEVSQGMVVAAEKDDRLVLLTAPKAQSGDSVYPENMQCSNATIDIDTFLKLNLQVEDKRVYYNDAMLKTDKDEVVATIEDGAKIR